MATIHINQLTVFLLILLFLLFILYIRKSKALKSYAKNIEKANLYNSFIMYWIDNNYSQKELISYMAENGLKRIAIYGMGVLGRFFYQQIYSSDIKVECFIDKYISNNSSTCMGIKLIGLNELKDCNTENWDAIIVTAFYYYNQVYDDLLRNGVNTQILPLDDIIYEYDTERKE